MTGKWKQIVAAKELLGLSAQATPQEIKQAYRRLSKKYHPDMKADGGGTPAENDQMRRLTEAYKTLMHHCENFLIPLEPGEEPGELDGEDWWMDRFGRDPLWGPGRDQKSEE